MASTAAQDEFNALFNKSSYNTGKSHPEDARSSTPRANGHGSDTSRSPSPAQSFLNLEDDDEDTAEDLAVKAMRGTYYIPRATRQANTGPKGVIADAQAFEQARRQAQSVRSVAQRPRQSYSQSNSRSPPAMVEDEKSSEEDEDDERFLESWRQKRLLELNQKSVSGMLGRGGKKVYGHLQRVDAEGFLNAVEGSPADTVVIVLIHDHSSEISNLVEEAVREMASTFTTSRFVKLHYTEAEFEPAGVPALLAYRNGDKFAGFVPVSDEIPDHEELSAKSLTALLQRHQVL